MKSKRVRKWAAKNCPYKKFKWHTEEMCKNCTKDAEEIESFMEIDENEIIGNVINEICEEKLEIDLKVGFIGRLLGQKRAVINALESLKERVKKIGE